MKLEEEERQRILKEQVRSGDIVLPLFPHTYTHIYMYIYIFNLKHQERVAREELEAHRLEQLREEEVNNFFYLISKLKLITSKYQNTILNVKSYILIAVFPSFLFFYPLFRNFMIFLFC